MEPLTRSFILPQSIFPWNLGLFQVPGLCPRGPVKFGSPGRQSKSVCQRRGIYPRLLPASVERKSGGWTRPEQKWRRFPEGKSQPPTQCTTVWPGENAAMSLCPGRPAEWDSEQGIQTGQLSPISAHRVPSLSSAQLSPLEGHTSNHRGPSNK